MNDLTCPVAIKLTDVLPIAWSKGRSEELPFFTVELDLAHVPPGCRLVLSGAPDGVQKLIVDDEIRVNGHSYDGIAGFPVSPPDYIGADPSPDIYVGVPPLDVTDDLRRGDTKMRIAFHDRGSVFCCGAVFLCFLCAAPTPK